MNANERTPSTEDATTCFFCGKKIAEGQWFARFRHESRLVVFCRPFCVESFLQQQERSAADRAAAFSIV